MVHDQAAIQELKSMFAEMKELLQQQVICGCVSVSNLKSITPSRQRLTTDCQKKKKDISVCGAFPRNSTFLRCFSRWFR